MVRVVIESMLGEVGRQILYFYEAHAVVLNTIVLAYGWLMLMSWLTMLRMYRYLAVRIAKDIHLYPDLNRKSTVKRVRDMVGIPWQEAVEAARFPLIAAQGALIPVRKSVKALQDRIDERELIRSAFEILEGTPPKKIKPVYRMMRKKEAANESAEV